MDTWESRYSFRDVKTSKIKERKKGREKESETEKRGEREIEFQVKQTKV